MLVATRNPLNIGAAARAMSNFGFLRLRVVNPHEAAFREARSAVGAEVVLERAEEYRSVAEAVADCTLVVGTTSGDRRAVLAAEAAIANPLLDEVSMKGARGLLISITGGNDLTLYEVDEAASRIRQEVDAAG